MSRRFALVLGVVTTLSLPLAAWAQKDKSPSLPPGELFFTGKGDQPFALERTFPGITGALLLTDEQKQKLNAVKDELMGSDAVREAGVILKTKANAGASDKEAARKVIDDARVKLQKEVAQLLTPDQKVLVEKINIAAKEAQHAAVEKYEADYAAAKGNEDRAAEVNKKMQEEAREEFARKMNNILTAEQKDSWHKAAAAQKAAEENSDKNKTK
jgi:Spy/CpxP family protein refolding chaperone